MAEIVELRADDIDADVATAWDALPPGRGGQADIYDSHAWFASWIRAAPTGTAGRVRIPAVIDRDRPIALLPLVLSGRVRAHVAGMASRTRARPVLGAEQPEPEVVDALAEAVARTGVRELDLHRLPSRDPATAQFVDALREAGYRVAQRERSCDNLASCNGNWADYARSLKGFASYAKRFTNRVTGLWDVTVDMFGASPECPAAHGFALYDGLQRRSWKGGFPPQVRRQREDLLARAEALGWARVFVLRIAGVPAAAHVWFRLGDVATWLSTAYDQRLAALSPGTVIMWQAQSRLFATDPPRVVDLLPGANPQKDRLTLERPPLMLTEAVRPTVWSGVSFPVRRHATRARAALRARLHAPQGETSSRPVVACRVATATAAPASSGAVACRLDLGPALRRYLATALGQASPDHMATAWAPGDQWWSVSEEPQGLLRVALDAGRYVVREVVRLDPAADPVQLARQLAAAASAEVTLRDTAVIDPILPWPRTWQRVAEGPAHAK